MKKVLACLLALALFFVGCSVGVVQDRPTVPAAAAVTEGRCDPPLVTGSEPWTQEALEEQRRANVRERFQWLTARDADLALRQPLAQLRVSVSLYIETPHTFRNRDEVETVRARDRRGVWRDGVRMLFEQLENIEDQQMGVENLCVATRSAYCMDEQFWYPFYGLPQPPDEPRVECYTLSGIRLFRYVPDSFFDPTEDPSPYRPETAVGRRGDIPNFLEIIGAQSPRDP